MSRNAKINAVLLLAVAALATLPLALGLGDHKKEPFTGADAQAETAITELAPEYEPWFSPLYEPPSGEVESALFALQAAIGAGVLAYYFGLRRGRRQGAERATAVSAAAVEAVEAGAVEERPTEPGRPKAAGQAEATRAGAGQAEATRAGAGRAGASRAEADRTEVRRSGAIGPAGTGGAEAAPYEPGRAEAAAPEAIRPQPRNAAEASQGTPATHADRTAAARSEGVRSEPDEAGAGEAEASPVAPRRAEGDPAPRRAQGEGV